MSIRNRNNKTKTKKQLSKSSRLSRSYDKSSKVLKSKSRNSSKNISKNFKSLNEDATIDGILVQMPLPQHLEKIPFTIDPKKDVDGFSFEMLTDDGLYCVGEKLAWIELVL